jgi:DNA-binding MarR family transcriptional regulator
MTDEAETREDTWYMNRPEPDDFILYPSWKREQDFMLKLAMLLALSEWVGGSLVIQEYHVIEALKLSKSVSRSVSNVIDQASKNPQTKAIADVEEALKKIGKAQHTFFSRLMRKKGITPEQLKKIIDGLVDEGQVSLSRSTSNAKVYEWVKGVEV